MGFPSLRPCSRLTVSFITPRMGFGKRGMADSHPPSKPRVFPCSGWDEIDASVLVEEESIPTYRPERFYSAQIGEVLNHRYQVVGKLGYGSSATVWLCRDLW